MIHKNLRFPFFYSRTSWCILWPVFWCKQPSSPESLDPSESLTSGCGRGRDFWLCTECGNPLAHLLFLWLFFVNTIYCFGEFLISFFFFLTQFFFFHPKDGMRSSILILALPPKFQERRTTAVPVRSGTLCCWEVNNNWWSWWFWGLSAHLVLISSSSKWHQHGSFSVPCEMVTKMGAGRPKLMGSQRQIFSNAWGWTDAVLCWDPEDLVLTCPKRLLFWRGI